MSLAVRAAARIARSYTGPAARKLGRAFADPVAAQAAVLQRIATATARTEYGRAHGITGACDQATWRGQLPVVDWTDLAPWIDRERERAGALVPDPVVKWARTRGATGPAKHVPYTAALERSFARTVYAWAHDLLADGLRLRTGVCYLEIDPPDVHAHGLDDGESGYLDGPIALLVRKFLAVDPEARRLRTLEAHRRVLALSLIAAADLEVVAIWDPDLFLAICDYILARRDELAAELDDRRATYEDRTFRFGSLSDGRRAALAAGDLVALWPALALVSTCATHLAAPGAAELARRLPHARHQGKGLLTTEAPLTIPIAAAGACLPIVDEIFYELETDDDTVVALHEATVGREYSLVISQPGGLVRYRIGDRVRVTARWQGLPCLEYVGRT